MSNRKKVLVRLPGRGDQPGRVVKMDRATAEHIVALEKGNAKIIKRQRRRAGRANR